jgi:RimJ/RimL family protein N-acetyltransferase
MPLPTLQTERLLLRPFRRADMPELIRLAGDRKIAATTLRIAHPYTENDAEGFFQLLKDADKKWFAIELIENAALIGSVGLRVEAAEGRAELGYWIGVPYWGKGYATEAATAALRHGFEDLKLNRIFATHFGHNSASGNILRKIGMKHEGCQRQHYLKWGEYVDSELYGILADEFARLKPSQHL